MDLLLSIPGGDPLKASEVHLVRALGEPVRWRFVVALSPESWGDAERDLVQRIRNLLLGQPCKVKPLWRDQATTELGAEATVIGASRKTEEEAGPRWTEGGWSSASVHYLEIEADGTSPANVPDPFAPRRRVHKVRNLKELVGRLDHVAKPIAPLQSELEQVAFPDGDKASIVQDGISDWLFLFHVFDQCRALAGERASWLPLTLVGGVDDANGTQGRWVVTPGVQRAYLDWNSIQERTIRFDQGRDGIGDIRFARLEGPERVPAYPAGELPSIIERRPQRVFDAGRWKTWRTMDMPRFTEDGAMVWRIEDRLYQAGHGLGWESKVFVVPAEARIVGPQMPGRLRPWMGLGRIKTTSRDGPWVEVQLPGFKAPDDVINARLGTAYSGKDGRRGLHMVPEDGTEILLAWGGRFDESIIVVGNARSEAAEHPSPSLYLEAEHTAKYAKVHVLEVGDITVDSKLALDVKKNTEIASSKQLEIRADGADLKMSGGEVKTGRS